MEVLFTTYFNNGLSLLKLTDALGYRIRVVGKNVQFAKKLFCNERNIPCHTTLPSTDPEYFSPDEQNAVLTACSTHVPDQVPFLLYYSSPYDGTNLISTFGCDSIEEYGTDKIMTFSNGVPNVTAVKTLIASSIPTLSTVTGNAFSYCSFSDTNTIVKSDGYLTPADIISTFLFRNSLNGKIKWSGDATHLRIDLNANFYCTQSTTITFYIRQNGSAVITYPVAVIGRQYTSAVINKILPAVSGDEITIYVSGLTGSERTAYFASVNFVATNLGGVSI